MDVADEMQNLGDFVAINGEEEEEEEFGEEEIEEQEASERGGISSAGEEIKHGGRSDSSSSGKIFVGGVAWETTEDTFHKYFKKYGEITDSVIMRDKHTNRPRGFGFITFADPSVVEKVLEEAHVIDGRTVEVKQTVPREEMTSKGGGIKTRKIFVGGLAPTLTEDELKEYFSSYGTVVENQIMLDHSTGRSRGFGFVTFESDGAVISEGKTHEIGGKQVEIKKAEPKRPDGDLRSNGRAGYGGGGANSYGGYGGSAFGYGGAYRSGGGYGGRMGGSYGGYAGAYGASAAGAYGGYGGYGYGAGFGAGFGGSMYGGAEYGVGDSYGSPGGYGGAYAGGGGYGGSRGYGSGGAANGRYHPYGR